MPNNIIMADAKGGHTFETVALPNSVTNGENLKTTLESMGITGPCILATTKKKAQMSQALFTYAVFGTSKAVAVAARWSTGLKSNEQKALTALYDFFASAGDEYMVIPCPGE